MLSKRTVIASLALCLTLPLTSVAFAQGKKPFTVAAFEAAQTSGKQILIDVSASWCPTCKAQAPILSKLMGDPRFKNVVAFNVDYDSQKDVLRKLNVQRQSTLRCAFPLPVLAGRGWRASEGCEPGEGRVRRASTTPTCT